MKKYLFLLVCVMMLSLSACVYNSDVTDDFFKESKIYQSKEKMIIDSGKYYSISKNDITQITYKIYNSRGDTVFSETTDRPLRINMLTDYIVDIAKGMGTGITVHKYYDAENNLFSEDFSYVIAGSGELIAYIDVPNEQPFENRKVIVRNIFDKNLFYNEYQVDFSDIDTPVIQAEFSEDGKSLMITYLSGEDQKQVSQTLSW